MTFPTHLFATAAISYESSLIRQELLLQTQLSQTQNTIHKGPGAKIENFGAMQGHVHACLSGMSLVAVSV